LLDQQRKLHNGLVFFYLFRTTHRKLGYFSQEALPYIYIKEAHIWNVWISCQASQDLVQYIPWSEAGVVLIDIKMGVGRSQYEKTARYLYSLIINPPHTCPVFSLCDSEIYHDLIREFDTWCTLCVWCRVRDIVPKRLLI
jgi:hypothetical protein